METTETSLKRKFTRGDLSEPLLPKSSNESESKKKNRQIRNSLLATIFELSNIVSASPSSSPVNQTENTPFIS
jgi:hypothetical protein